MSALGALPRLSVSARRALVVAGALAATQGVALVVQAWALGSALAAAVTRSATSAEIAPYLVVLAGAVVARAALAWGTETISARAAAGAKEELRARLVRAALGRGPEWIDRRGPAELSTLATKGLDALDAYFTKYLPALVTAGIVPPLVGAWILFSDRISAMIIAVTVPLIPLFAWLVGRYTEQRTARAAASIRRLSGQLSELIRALGVLTVFGRARAQGEVVRRVSEAHRRNTMATLRIAFLSALVLELLASVSVAVVAVGIGLRLVNGDLALATGLMVLVLAPECYLPLRAAGAAHHASEDGVEAVRRVDEALRERPASSSPRRGMPAIPDGAPLCVCGLRVPGRVGDARESSPGRQPNEFPGNASGTGDSPAGVSFTVYPGEVVRLDGFAGLGPSGSGKTTTLAALLGFTAIDEGTIRYGQVDLTEMNLRAWRRHLAWVPQRPAFTGETVADELALGVADQPAGTVQFSEEVLAEVAAGQLAQRRIDELSTGERQRVAVARALLRLRGRARVLLLDEPTANLDPATAERVESAVRRAADSGAMVVLASHRQDEAPAEPAAEAAVQPAASVEPTEHPGTNHRVRGLFTARALGGVGLGALSLLSGIALTALSAWLIARAAQQPPIMALTIAIVGVRTFALSRAGLRYAERLVSHDAAFRLSGRLRLRLWNALVNLGPVRAAGLRRGAGMSRLVDDVDTIRDLLPRVLLPPLIAVIVLVGAVAVQTAVLPAAGALLAAVVAVAVVLSPLAAVTTESRASLAVAEHRRQVSARTFTLFDGAAELLAFGGHAGRYAELVEADALLSRRSRRVAFGAGTATAVSTLLVGIAVLGGTWLAARAVAAGTLAPAFAPVLGLVPLAAAEAIGLLVPAAQQWRVLRETQRRIAPLLAVGDTVADESGTSQQCEDVQLSGVDLRWPGAAEPALRDVCLHLPAGTHVAVVGPSGGGKSTLLALLLGQLPAERGTVHASRQVSWCPQEPQLVSTTVRENLRLAAPEATDRRLTEALRLAGLPGWSHRLDTVVGSDGMALSGGEGRRLALARALLAEDASLVLLDEPTAHIDVPTADSVVTGLRRALRDRTMVHVTHRWAETEHADVVLRVADGAVTVLRDDMPRRSDSVPPRPGYASGAVTTSLGPAARPTR